MSNDLSVIYFDLDDEKYKSGKLLELTPDEMPVCTMPHFVHSVCKFFEEVTPNMNDNPIWQCGVDWARVERELKKDQPKREAAPVE